MKILAGKREDILRRKAEYENKLKTYKLARDGAKRAYNTVKYNALQPIRDELERNLSKFSLLKFDIRVDRSWYNGIEVRIICESNDTFKWDYRAGFTEGGEIESETNSWSGMNATTVDDIAILRQTVDALEYLISIDWNSLLNVTLPELDTYYNSLPERPESENFDDLLAEATLDDIVGQNKAILVERFNEFYYPLWIKIIKSTDKFYVISTGPDVYNNKIDESAVKNYDFDKYGSFKVKKDKLIPVEPIEIIDLG